MKSLTVGLLLALAFAGGCVASRMAVPVARADADATPSSPAHGTRWEYLCIDGWAGVTHSANQLGKEGWEMASAAGTSDHMMWCFKRPLL
ncbi:MAG TPA: hypothetical protein VHE30_07845 [Polyangiaceae bacterium]|nr:hypothetical protein [Polyangiaceae bacterium]